MWSVFSQGKVVHVAILINNSFWKLLFCWALTVARALSSGSAWGAVPALALLPGRGSLSENHIFWGVVDDHGEETPAFYWTRLLCFFSAFLVTLPLSEPRSQTLIELWCTPTLALTVKICQVRHSREIRFIFIPSALSIGSSRYIFLTRCLDSGVFLDMFVLFMKRGGEDPWQKCKLL